MADQNKPLRQLADQPTDNQASQSEDWKNKLTEEQFFVCRMKGTEAPFSGALTDEKREGAYYCVACDQLLFSSESKFDSGSGWPSFSEVVKTKNVELKPDDSHGMHRTEVLCSNCSSHLGHIFPDGPLPSGNRYCINSVALRFEPKEK